MKIFAIGKGARSAFAHRMKLCDGLESWIEALDWQE